MYKPKLSSFLLTTRNIGNTAFLLRKLSNKSKNKFEKDFIKQRYLDFISKNDFVINENQLKVVSVLDGLRNDLIQDNTKNKTIDKITALSTGKTMLMDTFKDSLDCIGVSNKRLHYHTFMQAIHSEVQELKSSTTNNKLFDPVGTATKTLFKGIKVLCLDEFQVTDIVDAMILRILLETLFKMKIVVVTTSNRYPDELYKDGLQRQSFIPCIELIKSKYHVVQLNIENNTDYRKLSTQLNLKYYGRSFVLNKYSKNNGVCVINFGDLFLNITRIAHVVFVNDIDTNLDLFNDKNILRRFVLFVDAIYDNAKSLILMANNLDNIDELIDCIYNKMCQSKDPHFCHDLQLDDRLLIDDLKLNINSNTNINTMSTLFNNKEESFAINRSFSRLIQMQSLSWISNNVCLENKQMILDNLQNLAVKYSINKET